MFQLQKVSRSQSLLKNSISKLLCKNLTNLLKHCWFEKVLLGLNIHDVYYQVTLPLIWRGLSIDVAPSDAKLHYPVHKRVLGPQNLYLLKLSKYLIICETKLTRWSQGDSLSQLIIYYFVCVTFNDRKEFVGKISLCLGSSSQNIQRHSTNYKCSADNLGLSLVSSYNLNYYSMCYLRFVYLIYKFPRLLLLCLACKSPTLPFPVFSLPPQILPCYGPISFLLTMRATRLHSVQRFFHRKRFYYLF